MITVHFGNLSTELKNKNLKLCFITDKIGLFLLDKHNKLYCIETYWAGSYLDKMIKNNVTANFNQVKNSVILDEFSNEIWDWKDIESFIKRHGLDMDDKEKLALAKDENTPADILMELSEDMNESVRQAVAGNTSCFEEVLVDLTADENENVYITAMKTLKKKKSGLEEKIRDCQKMSEKNKKENHTKKYDELEK